MKAIICQQFGPPDQLLLTDLPSPKAGKGQVVIRVEACGVNFPDTLIIEGKYQFKPPFPFSPGGEVSGTITEVGEGVSRLKVGDAVFSMTGHGGFAEEVVADAATTLPMPPTMDFVTAASTMYTYGTSYHALKDRANLQPGETMLVMGAAGGVGLAAVQLGVLMGARVIAAASSEEKLAVCRLMGATETINYTTENLRDRIKVLTAGAGVDVVYDPVGDRYAEPAIRSLAWRGRYLVVGFAAGDIPSIPLNLALLKGASIVGVFWGAFAQREPAMSLQNFNQILSWIGSGQLQQHIYKLYTLAEAPDALRDLMERRVVGKAVIKL
ncbi:NADPH:quinone oxidoreductase family protein [Spirosoma utsteinense]|uniref:NADPH2:quinone reductase n=1 Tax=Spirosoma utsteinense TaxID=2585773 RepID=A0ABR6W814_9BACT|nr:NADPH:quinone oxidoreductase family protein [Spirosoma utsteinense]MBC3788709.1 NADPH2:quinone reductase [Spirosoma utsteinense]MBC3792729.1 NADPH2:quinone reductase [Spirosoma utsteinense]